MFQMIETAGISSRQLSSVSPYVLHPDSQKFPQHRIWNGSNVCVIDAGPLSTIGMFMTTESVSHPFSKLYNEINAHIIISYTLKYMAK